jgi:hypothetical protein
MKEAKMVRTKCQLWDLSILVFSKISSFNHKTEVTHAALQDF